MRYIWGHSIKINQSKDSNIHEPITQTLTFYVYKNFELIISNSCHCRIYNIIKTMSGNLNPETSMIYKTENLLTIHFNVSIHCRVTNTILDMFYEKT